MIHGAGLYDDDGKRGSCDEGEKREDGEFYCHNDEKKRNAPGLEGIFLKKCPELFNVLFRIHEDRWRGSLKTLG